MKKLIVLIVTCCLLSVAGHSQLEVVIGASKTELRRNAVTIGLTYLKSFDSLFGHQTHFIPGKKSFFVITPELNIRTGTSDAYSSINVKATGLLTTFKTEEYEGLISPDLSKTFHIFPFAVGVETNNLFNNINGILEAGWIPYYQSYSRGGPDFIKKTNFGIWLQAGYKFKVDSTLGTGGGKDESLEQPDKTIVRLRSSAGIDTKELITINGLKIGLVGQADVWYDVINGAVYHKIEGRGRFYLNATQYIDFIYSKGSGAPLFNGADQYGVGITLTFK